MGDFDLLSGGFRTRLGLLEGTELDPNSEDGDRNGLLPDLDLESTTDPATFGRSLDAEADPTDRVPNSVSEGAAATDVRQQAEAAGELLNQEGTEGPSRSVDSAPRGAPVITTPGEGGDARSIWRKNQARIRSLTEMFGQDALVLGHLLFKVPPLAIRVKKGNMTYRWKPLRTQESIAVKSGNGECYIEIDLAFVGINQIQHSLADLIALWKSVPFCFIENIHIRKMVVPDEADTSMAVCLETLVMDAVSGSPNTVYATLILKWFNYRPFSQNFWFRREWKPATGMIVHQASAEDSPPDRPISSDNRAESEGGTESLAQNLAGTSILADLSAIQDPDTLTNAARVHPPEIGLWEADQLTNPGDPTLDGTFPVTYPFNSEPFMQRVRRVGRPQRVLEWNDGLTMSWNSFARMPVPSAWEYTVGGNRSVSVSAEPPRPRIAGPGRTSGSDPSAPPPVTGDRDIIIFIGDSIMVGFTRQSSTDGTAQSDTGVPFFEWSGNSNFPVTEGFRYFGMMRVGARSSTMLSWWNAKKNLSVFKAENNDQPCSRVAGVVIHAGTNDGPGGPRIENIQSIMSEASGYGAIPILLCQPPFGDADYLSPPMLSNLRAPGWWSDAEVDAYLQAVPDYHRRMGEMTESIGNGMFIDYHLKMVEERFRGNRAAPLAEQYMNKNSPSSGYYNVHWNSTGYREGGIYIHGRLPWNSLRGIAPEPEEPSLWTVCSVEDGDTVWVWGNDPDTGERTLRNVRFQYVDTLETYHHFENADFNTGGPRALPEGQDSYRPDDQKYGKIATVALQSQLRVDDTVEIRWGGTGNYGRYLGEIFKGDQNINLWMVYHGYGFANIPHRPSHGEELGEQEIGYQYWLAEEIAAGRRGRDRGPAGEPCGIHAAREVTLINPPEGLTQEDRDNLSSIMPPADFRRLYVPSSDGGHGGAPDACSEDATRGYIIVNGNRLNVSFPVNHSLQFNVDEHNLQTRSASATTQGILHWTGGEGSGRTCYDTLVSRRLSCHFSLDRDGTLWQFCDPATTISHSAATAVNNVAWSIEITCYGVQTSPAARTAAGRARSTYQATLQGEEYTVGDYTDAQYATVLELCNLIHTNLNIPKVAFTSPHHFVGYSNAAAARGVIGHYQASDQKTDPGPRIFERLAALPGWTGSSL